MFVNSLTLIVNQFCANAGANPNARGIKSGATPLHSAAAGGHLGRFPDQPNTVRFLISNYLCKVLSRYLSLVVLTLKLKRPRSGRRYIVVAAEASKMFIGS